MRAPTTTETRYANHMAAIDSQQFEMRFFTWRLALTGDYDIFHLHWPEQLLGRDTGVGGWLRWMRLRALLARLRWRRTPVVYTLHNLHPHDRSISRRLDRILQDFDALTQLEIHLVPEPDRSSTPAVTIPHGGYIEAFAEHRRSAPIPGRLLTFGIIKRYKGISGLLDAFASVEEPHVHVRVVGEPADSATVATIDAAVASDSRVTARYGFVVDEDLVAEVTMSQLVVLPYDELHSSGAVLVALSLNRPILIPDSPTARALRDEVGAEWVHVFVPPLGATSITDALSQSPHSAGPDLSNRAWAQVRAAHLAAYRRMLT